MESGREGLLLDGLKVLEVATFIAAPVAATMLADLGAKVIKVEQAVTGDAYRRIASAPGLPRADANYCWLTDARNKRSITLNLRDPEARAILTELARDCDVYITNQPLPLRRELGLAYEEVSALNERIIYASVTAYGEHGPDADREGFDAVAWWTRSGLADVVRSPGSMPGSSVPGMGDHPTAVSLFASILVALMRRERTGRGSLVHTNLMHNGLWSNACLASAAFVDGVDFSPMDARPVTLGRAFCRTADGRLLQLSMVRSEAELDALLIAAGAADLLEDERFRTTERRAENMTDFVAEVEALIAHRTAKEWLAVFGGAGVNVSLVAQLPDLADDPQIEAAGAVVRPIDASIGARFVIRPPWAVEGLPRSELGHAPECGEHTDEILRELGRSAAQIDSMRARNAV